MKRAYLGVLDVQPLDNPGRSKGELKKCDFGAQRDYDGWPRFPQMSRAGKPGRARLSTGKSRIKRLRGLSHPQYRLRAGDDIRVFYDVTDEAVQILAIVQKSKVDAWLAEHGENDETSSSV